MKVAHVVPTYWPAVRYGGPIFSVHGLCRSLVESGVEVDVYTTNVDGEGVLDVPLGTPVDVDGVTVRYFETGIGRRLYRSPSLAEELEARIAEYDVVHTHSIFLWPVLAASRIAAAHDVPYVSTPRGMLVRELVDSKSTWIKTAWLSLIEKKNLEGASLVHATSATERADITAFGYCLKRIAVVPNGIDSQDYSSIADICTNPTPTILCLGRISWKKGLDMMIAALKMLPDVQLVIAGNDDEGYTETLSNLAASCGVSDRVRFPGAVYGEDKLKLLQSSHLVALPSRSENFANVILEAMAASRPVLVTAEVGMAEIVLRARCGRVVDPHPSSIAMGARRLLSQADQAREMGMAGRVCAKEQFDWRMVASQMQDQYRALLKNAESDATQPLSVLQSDEAVEQGREA